MASVRKREWEYKGEPRTAWVVTYTDAAGKARLKTFKSKKEADRGRLKIETELSVGQHVADSATITFAEAIDLWLDRCEDRVKVKDRLRMSTVRTWIGVQKIHLRPQLGALKVKDITGRAVQKWMDDLAYDREKPRSHAIIQKAFDCLRLILKDARRRGFLHHDPLLGAELRIPGQISQPTEIPSKVEVKALLTACSEDAAMVRSPYLRPMLMTAVLCGLRMGELRALTWDSIDFKAEEISVYKAADRLGNLDEPKTRKGIRRVPMAPELMLELKKWKLRAAGGEAGLVFQSSAGTMVLQSTIHQSWCRLQGKVFGCDTGKSDTRGLYHFHALRHFAASLFIESGLPPKRIQTIMGHASITMTFDRYGHLFEDKDTVKAAFSKIGRDLIA